MDTWCCFFMHVFCIIWLSLSVSFTSITEIILLNLINKNNPCWLSRIKYSAFLFILINFMKYIKQLFCYDLFWILLVGDNIYFKDIDSPKLIWREIIHKLGAAFHSVWLIITAFHCHLDQECSLWLYKTNNTLSGNHPK